MFTENLPRLTETENSVSFSNFLQFYSEDFTPFLDNPSLLQGIFPIQGLNPGLLHCRRILYHLSHLGSPSNNYLTIIHHENSTEFYLMEIYPICMGDTPLSMRFSRQEYWSGVPLPSPDTLKNLYILG